MLTWHSPLPNHCRREGRQVIVVVVLSLVWTNALFAATLRPLDDIQSLERGKDPEWNAWEGREHAVPKTLLHSLSAQCKLSLRSLPMHRFRPVGNHRQHTDPSF